MKGRIKNYFDQRGFGFILGEDSKERFFHIKDVKSTQQPTIGGFVEFEPQIDSKGLVAKDIHIQVQKVRPTYVEIGKKLIRLSDINEVSINYTDSVYTPHPEITSGGTGEYLYIKMRLNEFRMFFACNVEFDIHKKYKEIKELMENSSY